MTKQNPDLVLTWNHSATAVALVRAVGPTMQSVPTASTKRRIR